MAYTVIIKKTAQKQILALPKNYYEKVRKVILSLETNPRPNGYIKLTGSDDIYRIRIGIYRLVYSIEDATTSCVYFRRRPQKRCIQVNND